MAAKKTSAKTATKTGSKRTKTASGSKKPVAAQSRPAKKSFGYNARAPYVIAACKSLGSSATLDEMFEELHGITDDAGDSMFAQPRRIPATLRNADESLIAGIIQNVGGTYSMIKRAKRTAKKSVAKRVKRATK